MKIKQKKPKIKNNTNKINFQESDNFKKQHFLENSKYL